MQVLGASLIRDYTYFWEHFHFVACNVLFWKFFLFLVQRSLFENLCGDRLWAFERVRDAFLNGYVEKEVQNVQTKEECERLCLTEVSFICRSADYDEVMRVCRMSKEDRRSQPQAFREVVGSNRDYLENQCAASGKWTFN